MSQLIPVDAFFPEAFTGRAELRVEACAMLKEEGVWKSLGFTGVSSVVAFKRWCIEHGVEEENLTMHFYVFEIQWFTDRNCGMIEEKLLRERIIKGLIQDDCVVKQAEYTVYNVEDGCISLNGSQCRLHELVQRLHDEASRQAIEGYVLQQLDSKDGPPNGSSRCLEVENDYPRLSDRCKVKKLFEFTLAVFKYRNTDGDPRFILAGRETYFDLRIVGTLDPKRCSQEVRSALQEMPFTTGRTIETAGLDYLAHSKTTVQVQCTWISFEQERLQGVKYIHTCRKGVSKTDISFVHPEDDPYWRELKRRNIIAKRLMEAKGYQVGRKRTHDVISLF